MATHLGRREFISALGGGVVTWPFAALAQRAERLRRIGVMTGLTESDPQNQLNMAAFRQGLQDLGWSVDRNLRIEFRFGAEGAASIRAAAAELVEKEPEVILAQGTANTAGLQQVTRTIPIVFTVVSDPVGSGFAKSLAHPGGNITGFTNFFEPSFASRWLELLKEMAPHVTRVSLLFNPDLGPSGGLYFVLPVETAAQTFAMESTRIPVHNAAEIEHGIEAFAQKPNGGLIVPPDATTLPSRDLIVALAARFRLPAVYPYRFFVASGGLISYGIAYADVFRRAASYVDRILRGEKPEELPVQIPTKFELAINLKTVKALGLTVPQMLFATADEVIE
jgi:putative ABC transport system substrate-binding protein